MIIKVVEMEDTVYYLLILGVAQFGLVVITLGLFISPFICLWSYYPYEPAPRVVQLAYPTIRKVPFVLFVNQTVIHQRWYVASISQYAGARGSTAAKILTFATTAGGVLQIMLSILIWFYNTSDYANEGSHSNHARLVLLLIGGIACVFIGQAESAILWKYGRQQQIYVEWASMSLETRKSELNRSTQTLSKVLSTSLPSTGAIAVSINNVPTPDSNIIVHPQWTKVCDSLLASNDNTSPLLTNNPNDHQVVTVDTFTSALVETKASSGTMVNDVANGNLIGTMTYTVATEALKDLRRFSSIETPNIPPEGYITFRAYEKGGDDIVVGGIQELILENDDSEKNEYSTIHMVSALLLIICSFVAHILTSSTVAQWVSMIVASVGMAFFIIFCLMQYIAGNYDTGIPEILTTQSPGCLFHMCRCSQMEPDEYPCNKKILGIAFIFVEMIAFGSIMVSTGIEGILIYLQA
jgi:hypothetical protein